MARGRRRRWLAAVSVAAQVSGDNAEVTSEPRRDLVPHDVGLGYAVQQKDWRARAAMSDPDPSFPGVDGRLNEPFEHPPAPSW